MVATCLRLQAGGNYIKQFIAEMHLCDIWHVTYEQYETTTVLTEQHNVFTLHNASHPPIHPHRQAAANNKLSVIGYRKCNRILAIRYAALHSL